MMHPEIREGYTIYKNGYGPVWVALHSGPAVASSSRDDNSDTISTMCWRKTGGTLIFSNMPRDMVMGIDFNRDLPNQETAVSMYPKLISNDSWEDKINYKKEFAFVSENRKCYVEKAKIYKSLWSFIRNSGDFVIFLHRQYSRLKNYPSAIDLITFNDCGIKKEILKKIIEDLNSTHVDFFKNIEKNFKNITYIEQIKKINSMGVEKRNSAADVKIIEKHCDNKTREMLEKDFNQRNLIYACENALRNMPRPEITMERVFSAETAIGPKKEIIKNLNKIAIEVEINSFMGEWYPQETTNILLELVDKIKKVDEYKKMGFNQTQILKFI